MTVLDSPRFAHLMRLMFGFHSNSVMPLDKTYERESHRVRCLVADMYEVCNVGFESKL